MNSLFDIAENFMIKKGLPKDEEDPSFSNASEALTKSFADEQKAKITYQPFLAAGLFIFLIIQLIKTNEMYENVITTLLSIEVTNADCYMYYFDLYENILNQMKFYTTAILCEFIAIFYFIIRWGFSTKVSDLFSGFINKSRKGKENKCQDV